MSRFASSMLALLVALSAGCSRPAPPPNVVVVLIDTLRQDHLAVYGYERETAPALTALAADSAVLDGLSPSSWTKPAVASLFTGLHPLRHAAYARYDGLPEEAVTFAEILRAEGYDTLGVSANGFVTAPYAMTQGFSEFIWMGKGKSDTDPPAPADKVNAALLPRLEGLRSPFFLYVHYIDPHTPYDPPIGWNGSPLSAELREIAPVKNDRLHVPRRMSRPPELLRKVSDLYDGEIRFVDGHVAALLEALRERGGMDDAILVVTSDHGEELEDHGRMGHGQTLYEEVTRVPLLVRAPGRVVPGRRRGAVSLLDVLPTVLDLAGFEPPDDLDGRSLASWVASEPAAPAPSRRHLLHLDFPDGAALALVDGTDKLILSRHPFGKELYDLATDPRENADRFAESPPASEAMRRALAAEHNRLAARTLERVTPDVGESHLHAIKALGYVASSTEAPPFEPRRIPAGIGVADASPVGSLGFTGPDQLLDCVRLADEGASRNLLAGWYPARDGKPERWAAPVATLLLKLPAERGTLRLAGTNHDRRTAELVVRVDGSEIERRTVAHGAFDFRLSLPRAASRHARVELERHPPFRPADLGMPDDRTLGLAWSEICATPRAAGPDA